MKLFNTLSGKKELIQKTRKPLRLFVCGPTVYDTPHIGNYRTFLAFDTLVTYMRSRGYIITYLQNITDIDDKIIRRAQEENISWKSIAQTYERIYHQGEKLLGITAISAYARATQHIPEIIRQIQTLIKKGYAYKIEGDGYYFDIAQFSEYGKLSHRTVAAAEDATSRIDESSLKRNKGDFALWKFSKEGEPSWKTSLGEGRPGWHIEDTAITEKYFGPQYDMHGGAGELKFPHHEAEIAQQEAASGKKPFVRTWIHTGILLTNGKKMSKSLKNFIGVTDFLTQYDARVLRYITLAHHYSSPIDYTPQLALQSATALETIQKFILKLSLLSPLTNITKSPIKKMVATAEKEFHTVLADNFNTPQALAIIFSLLTTLESRLTHISPAEAVYIQKTILSLFASIGIVLSQNIKIPASIARLSKQREQARFYKQFIQADTLRNKIHQLGYSIEDTPWGPFITPIHIFVKHKK
ncbi:MAG: cysteine--tRNA ligase [Candidatus Paceibacterota bacterium]